MIRTYRPPRDRCTRRKRASRASWRTLNKSCGLCRRQRAGSRRALSPAQSRSRLAAASTEADEAALERRFGALLPCAIAPKRSKAARSAPLGCRVALHRRGALVLLTHPARASGRLRAPRSRSRRSVRPARVAGQRALQPGAGAASASRLPRASRWGNVVAPRPAFLIPLRGGEVQVVFTSKKFVSLFLSCSCV